MQMPNSCFVVQAMDGRSGFLFEWYVKGALSDKYTVVPPGNEPSIAITEDIFRHLREDALVVVLLGSPYRIPAEGNHWLWNPNVMLEAGYRMALKRPLLFLREKRVQPDEPLLPFDLVNISVIELLSNEDERDTVKREGILRSIREYASILDGVPGRHPEVNAVFAFPAVTLAFGGGHGRLTAASNDAAA